MDKHYEVRKQNYKNQFYVWKYENISKTNAECIVFITWRI